MLKCALEALNTCASDKEFDLKYWIKIKKTVAVIAVSMLTAVFILQFFPAAGSSLALTDRSSAVLDHEIMQTSYDRTSIEADPSRMNSAGYVTITIKLRNTNPAAGSDSLTGEGSFGIQNNFGIGTDSTPTKDPNETETPTPDPGNNTPAPTTDPNVTETPITTPDPNETEHPTDDPNVSEAPSQSPTGGTYTNVSIENSYGVNFTTFDVAPGETGVYRATMFVSESQLGQSLYFRIYWVDTATNTYYYHDLNVTILRSDTAFLRMTRTSSVTDAQMGEVVELTYTLVNTGTRRLNNITVIDEKIRGNNPLVAPFSLSSGETNEFVINYTMQGATVVSKPTATFVPEGSSTPLSVTVSKITIGLINAQLSKSVTIGRATPEGVPFTLYLTNNGSQSLTNLSVKDDLGREIGSNFSLAIGESKILDYFVPNPDSERNVFFTITGTYASGKEFVDNTTSYPVRPYIDLTLLGLDFTAEIRKPLDADCNIGLTFTAKNTGRLPYYNLVLTEKELGYDLYEIPVLAAGEEPNSFNVDVNIGEPRELIFYLTAMDSSGNSYTFDAYINADRIEVQSAIPNETPVPGGEQGLTIVDIDVDKQISERGEQLINWWKKLEIIFFCAMGLIAVLATTEFILYLTRRRRRKNADNYR